ncbi:cell wall hydrolase [Kaarinaea lacus]
MASKRYRKRRKQRSTVMFGFGNPFAKVATAIGLDKTMVNVRFFWREMGPINQVLIIAATVFVMSTSATLYKVFADKYEMRDIRCLSMNIYHEARGEPDAGKYAVGKVTMNRVASSKYPNDVCRVVYQQHRNNVAQFSWTNDDITDIPKESKAWLDSVRVARAVYNDENPTKVADALFYHADYVKPRWAAKKVKIAKIGRHIFYK